MGGEGALPRVFFLDILDRASALYTTNRKARGIRKAADHPGLPFQRALNGLVELPRLVQTHNVNVSLCGTDDKQLVLGVHGVHSVLTVDVRDRGRLAQVPVLDRLVPRSRNQDRPCGTRHIDEASTADGLLVRGDLGGSAGLQVHHAGGFVCACADDFGAILQGVSTSNPHRDGRSCFTCL